MSQVTANPNDGRKRYTHQAMDVTYMGKSRETGPSGYVSRFSATYQCSILMPTIVTGGRTAGDTAIIGDFTEGIWMHEAVIHAVTGTFTSGDNLVFSLPAHAGESAVANLLTVALDSATAAKVVLNTPQWVPLAKDRPLQVQFAAGAATKAGSLVLSFLATPAESGWK